jgi:hypothetical protein
MRKRWYILAVTKITLIKDMENSIGRMAVHIKVILKTINIMGMASTYSKRIMIV